MPATTMLKKPSFRSDTLKKCIYPLIPGEKMKTPVNKLEILPELLRNILTGNEVSIKDHYAALVSYLVLHIKELSYDQFVGTYESVKIRGCESKHSVCLVLPYGALVASGIILKWEPEQQNQIVAKMLKISQKDPESGNVLFHFLIALINNVKSLNLPKLKSVNVLSLVHLYFMLSVDSKRDESTAESSIFSSGSIVDLVDVYLEEWEDRETYKKVSVLLAKKLLSLPDEGLKKFWGKLMASYLNQKSNYKELVILHLLSSLLENYDKSESSILKDIFTSPLIKLLSKSNLNTEPMKSITSSLKNISQSLNSELKLALIDTIVVNTPKFLEKVAVVKLCDILIGSMSFEEVSAVCDIYRKIIMGEKHKTRQKLTNADNDFNNYEKIYSVRCLGKLVSHNSCKIQVNWRKDQIKFLFKIGFLSEYKDSISSHLSGISRKVFYSCLNQKFAKLTDFEKVLNKLVKFAGGKMDVTDDNFVVPVKEKAVSLWSKALTVVKGLSDGNKEDNLLFRVLIQYMMLFMYSNYLTAKNSLEELFKVVENKELISGGLHWTEVTVDLFLHLLSASDNTHRNVITSTFSHVCKHITPKGLNLILSAVKGKNDEGSDLDEEDEDLNDDGSSGEDSVNDEEDEDIDASAVDGGSNDEDEGADSDDEVDGHEGQNDQLKDALRQELYKIDTASTCGSVDLDNIDDDEGKLLNSTLGQIFKAQHGKYISAKKNKVDNLEIHFRIRALDLLEIYLENKPPLSSTTTILTSVISLLKASIPNHVLAPFTASLKKCLKKLTNLREFSNSDCVTEISLCSILNQILERDCPASVYQDMTEQIIDSSLFVIRASSLVSESSEETIDLLKTRLHSFFLEDDSQVLFHLFTSIFSSLTLPKLIGLTPKLVKFAFSKKIKLHKRALALQLLITFYNNNRLFKDVGEFQTSLESIEKKIFKKSLKFLNQVHLESFEMNKKFGCMFLDLLCLLKTKNKGSTGTNTYWDSTIDIVNAVTNIPLFAVGLKVSFLKFCKIFNIDLPKTEKPSLIGKKEKRKSLETNGISVAASPVKKKKKNNMS